MNIRADISDNTLAPRVLEGEILLPGSEGVKVVFAPHPLRQEVIRWEIPAGGTIGEILDECMRRYYQMPVPEGQQPRHLKTDDFRVLLGEGNLIPPENWERVRPKPGVHLVFRVVPRPPVVAIIGAIIGALSTFSAWLSSLGFLGNLIWAGITLGIKLLLNKLFAPKQPKTDVGDRRPAFSLTGSRNEANQYGAIPVILGKHRIAPYLGGTPYTEIVGEDQYLRMCFVVGYGPLKITDIKIGETPISKFEDVQYQVRPGYSVDEPMTYYPKHVFEEQLSIKLLRENGWESRETGEDITSFSLDLQWPEGLNHIDDEGEDHKMWTWIIMRYRMVEPTLKPWKNVVPLVHMGRETFDPIRVTKSVVNLPKGKYEVQLKKDWDEIITEEGEMDQTFQDVYWTALRGFRSGEPITFPKPVTTISMRIRAQDQLNGTVDTLNCIAQSLTAAYDGVKWVGNTLSQWPPDLFRHVLTSNANERPVPLARIDLVALQNWKSYCTINGFRYNRVLFDQRSILDQLLEICAAGRAMPIFKDGKWSVVWDEQNPPVVQMFTPRNSWGFEVQQEYFEMPHAFRCRFVNEDKDYVDDERIAYDDGYNKTNATRFEAFEVPGVTDKDQIWKMARFHIAQLRLRPATYNLYCDWEGISLIRNDRVRVQHDVILVGLYAGRVKSVQTDPDRVTVDETLLLDGLKSYSFIFRLDNGTFLTRTLAANQGGEFTTVTLSGASSLPPAGCLFTCGETGSETSTYRVLGVEPQDDMVFRLTLVDDAPAIANADTGAIPDFDPNITKPVDPFEMKPAECTLSASAYKEGTKFWVRLRIMWKLTRVGNTNGVQVQYRNEVDKVWRTVNTFPVQTLRCDVSRLKGLVYTARVRSHFKDGTWSAWTQSKSLNTATALKPPADVKNFRVATNGTVSTLSWTAVPGQGVTYEIRYAVASVANPQWNSCTPIVRNVGVTQATAGTRIGSYLIKAYFPSGLSSVNASIIKTNIASLEGLNYIHTVTDTAPWPGSMTNVEDLYGELRLLQSSTMSTWDQGLGAVVTLVTGDEGNDSLGFRYEGYYYLPGYFDLGQLYVSRVVAELDSYGYSYTDLMAFWDQLGQVDHIDSTNVDGWQAWVEFSDTSVDPALGQWQGYSRILAGFVEFRAIRFRIHLRGKLAIGGNIKYATSTPSVKKVDIVIDMPERTIYANDVAVPATGKVITWAQPFRGPTTPAIAVSAQGLGTGDYYTLSAKSVNGFTIQFKTSAGAGVARTFDYVAKGYGIKK
jgi:hypothetical protein